MDLCADRTEQSGSEALDARCALVNFNKEISALNWTLWPPKKGEGTGKKE